MSKYMSKRFASLVPYVPGEQPKDRKFIKLNTNESPYPPAPGVIEAIDSEKISELRLYEDPDNSLLKQAMASYYSEFNLTRDNFCMTAGSDEALELAFIAYGDNGASYPDLTYGFYDVFCNLHHIDILKVPLEEDFSIDITKYMTNKYMIVIANPNAPTSLAISIEDIEKILSANPDQIVLIDEAYVDFGSKSALSLVGKYENLLVTQTFSKSRSLAGARIGFVAGQVDLIRDLETIKNSRNPYNISYLSQIAGLKSIEDEDYFRTNVGKTIRIRESVSLRLKSLGFEVLDSKTNFVFAKHDRVSGDEIYSRLREAGILVRHFATDRIKEYNRITIGSADEMDALVGALEEIVGN